MSTTDRRGPRWTRLSLALALTAAPAALAGNPANASTSVPGAALAASSAKPTGQDHSLRGRALSSVPAAGPSTAIPAETTAMNGGSAGIAGIGTPAARPALGQGSDAVVTVPATGDLIAVTWPAGTAGVPGLRVLVRAKTAAGWQAWRETSVEQARDVTSRSAQKLGTEPLWEAGAQQVQIRVARSNAALLSSATLAMVSSPVAATDSRIAPSSTGIASARVAGSLDPSSVITRAQWGADESWRKGCTPAISSTTKAVVIHHTAGTNSYTKAQSAAIVRSLYYYDTKTLGWCDIAYNVMVDKYGQKFEGRFGGLNKQVKSASTDTFNNYVFSISMMGNQETAAPTAAGLQAMTDLVAMRLNQFYLPTWGKVDLTAEYNGTTSRYRMGQVATVNSIFGHRDTSYTLCPGKYLYPQLSTIRNAMSGLVTFKSNPVYLKYVAAGGASTLGAVNVAETAVATNLTKTVYTSTRRIYRTPANVTALMSYKADVGWWANGGATGLGYPKGDEIASVDGTVVSFTTNQIIATTPSSPGVLLSGPFLSAWQAGGGVRNTTLGTPKFGVQVLTGATAQQFTRGTVYRTSIGQFNVLGKLRDAYVAAGGSLSALGLPVANQSAGTAGAGSVSQKFANGTLTVTSTGSVITSLRK